MTEKLLQYIWQFQYFNRSGLETTEGESLQIIFPGQCNTHQGPDFVNAQIKIGHNTFFGSVELHLKTSLWFDHKHQHDSHYKNVVLHVVYENDCNDFHLPVLELQPRVSQLLLYRYEGLMMNSSFIACAQSVSTVKELTWISWKERLLAERLNRKSNTVSHYLTQNKNNWEESFWWLLARTFGAKVNAGAFEAIARSVSIQILAKHKGQIHQIEGLLFGQAGLLQGTFEEEYPKLLQREYTFLQKKYGLKPIHEPVYFLRMRPQNFPSVRLAQLAALIQQSSHLFSKILEAETINEVEKLFSVTANDYWHSHYRFDELSGLKKKILGREMRDTIIINAVIPTLFAYGQYHNQEKYKAKAVLWLEGIKAETNAITRRFSQLHIGNKTAFDSQALIELKTNYCDERKCLNCSIGNAIIKG